jgi:hypothetical protein
MIVMLVEGLEGREICDGDIITHNEYDSRDSKLDYYEWFAVPW